MSTKRKVERLIFVFSAESGSFNAFIDSAKKVLRIKGCTLCAITHGLVGEKSDWKDCRDELGVHIDYVHRDELDGELARVVADRLPCVVAEADGELLMLLTPDVLDRCRGSVADMRGRLQVLASMNGLELPGLVSSTAS